MTLSPDTPSPRLASNVTAERFRPFGESIFAQMTALAVKHNAVNLAQGFPDFDGPEAAKEAAIAAVRAGHGQYAPMTGVKPLREAIARAWNGRGGPVSVDADRHITVTCGCSEALINCMVGVLNPGDEVVLFEPFFDFYTAGAAMAGARPRVVTLRSPDAESDDPRKRGFWFERADLERAITPKTRMILVNTPHNPTGKVYTREELSWIAEVAQRHDLIVVTDEVYEHLVFDGATPHLRLAEFPGMWERTITLSSLGKTHSLTGWKVGWAIAPEPLSAAVRACHQFMTFSGATPLQLGAAAVVERAEESAAPLRALYKRNRDTLSAALTRVGFRVHPSDSTYFVMADHTGVGIGEDDRAAALTLAEKAGVVAVPTSVFYETKAIGRTMLRFAFCKKEETIAEAVRRLERLAAGR